MTKGLSSAIPTENWLWASGHTTHKINFGFKSSITQIYRNYVCEPIQGILSVQARTKACTVNVVVDAVFADGDLEPESVHAAPALGNNGDNEFIQGIGILKNKMITRLEVDNILDWDALNTNLQQQPTRNDEQKYQRVYLNINHEDSKENLWAFSIQCLAKKSGE